MRGASRCTASRSRRPRSHTRRCSACGVLYIGASSCGSGQTCRHLKRCQDRGGKVMQGHQCSTHADLLAAIPCGHKCPPQAGVLAAASTRAQVPCMRLRACSSCLNLVRQPKCPLPLVRWCCSLPLPVRNFWCSQHRHGQVQDRLCSPVCSLRIEPHGQIVGELAAACGP